MSEIFDYTSHKLLWRWLAENPGKTKREALKALGMSMPPEYYNCYACLYAMRQAKMRDAGDYYCNYCPLFVTGLDIAHVFKNIQEYIDSDACLYGLYTAWESFSWEQNNDNFARDVALIIANLSVRAGVPIK